MNLIGDWHIAQLRTAEQEKKINFDWDVVPVPHPAEWLRTPVWRLPYP